MNPYLAEVKASAVEHASIASQLLTGRWSGQPLRPTSDTLLFGTFLIYLFTSATKRIVGYADAGPLSALVVPLLWVGIVFLARFHKRSDETLFAFVRMSIALNLLLLASVAIGLDNRVYQWALECWLLGATGYFFYKLPQGELLEEVAPDSVIPEEESPVIDKSWRYKQWDSDSTKQ